MKRFLQIATSFFLLSLAHADNPFSSTENDMGNAPQEESISLVDMERLFEIMVPDDINSDQLLKNSSQNENLSSSISQDQSSIVFNEDTNGTSRFRGADSSSMILFAQDEEIKPQVSLAQEEKKPSLLPIKISFQQVFQGSPLIYSLLFMMSIVTLFIWLYSQIHLRSIAQVPTGLPKNLKAKLISNQYDDALNLCNEYESVYAKMVASGILARKHGLQVMLETMKSEGRRSSIKFWQRIALLNDIAIIAPMIGLLGTVLGMFYAFYDMNRSTETITSLFDGLGISVGTTVAGLIVAIMAMMLYSVARYRLVRRLAIIEHEASSIASLIDNPR